MKPYSHLVISCFLTIVTISCQKINEANRDSLDFVQVQTLIIQELDNRTQVIAVSHDSNGCNVAFSDGITIKFSGSVFPILHPGNDNVWSINGSNTNIPIKNDETGNIEIPSLSIGESDLWTINGTTTSISANSYISCLKESLMNNIIVEGLLLYQNDIYFFLSDKTYHSLSIIQEVAHIVPSYYIKHLKEKEMMAEKAISDAKNNCASFIFFSDTHWDNNFKHSPSLIRHIYDFSGISKVFFGGDVIYKHAKSPQEAIREGLEFQKSFNFLGPNFYCVYGNHDNNSEGQVNKTEEHLTDEQVSTFLQSQMTILNKKEGFNFYFDEYSSKTRYIGLDTGRYYRTPFRTNFLNTAGFLIESLQSVPEQWHVVVISHIFMATSKKNGVYECGFATYCDFPLIIMDKYNQRLTGKTSYRKETISYDFSDCKGHIDLCIGGHVHRDGFLITDGGIPVLSVPTDSRNVINNEVVKKGTISEQSISIIILDYSSSVIKSFSVGRGSDHVIDIS